MHNPGGRYTIVFNSEIYNFGDLRQELENCGHRFASSSDTEVLLYHYNRLGSACVHRLRCMFAFAICCRREHRAFLARGRHPAGLS